MNLGISPVRISFAGGGTDLPEYFKKFGGNVVTTSINQFTYVITTPRNDKAIQIFSSDFQIHYKPTKHKNLKLKHGSELVAAVINQLNFKSGANIMISSEVPPGSGLGASSSLAVNLINTLSFMQGKHTKESDLAEKAFKIGRNFLKWPIGKQDEYIASFGGFNFIKFERNKVQVKPIKISKSSKEELEKNLLLFYLGKTRNSSDILKKQIGLIKDKNEKTLESLHEVNKLAKIMYKTLEKSDLTSFGNLLNTGWMAKKNFAKNVSNESIDKIYEKARKLGALGGKLTGAGGGGHLLLYVNPEKQKKVISSLERAGLKKVEFSFYQEKPKVLNLYDFTKA